MYKLLFLFVFAALSAGSAATADALLQSGEYLVTVRLELPHVEDLGFSKETRICIAEGGTRGFTVLSDNNPLTRCPASNIRQDGGMLTFDLVCEGHNQAVAWAKFAIGADHFDGAFDMKMGGKNMTMTEHQAGRRVGACANSDPSLITPKE